jgi:uncharacterized protein YxeA
MNKIIVMCVAFIVLLMIALQLYNNINTDFHSEYNKQYNIAKEQTIKEFNIENLTISQKLIVIDFNCKTIINMGIGWNINCNRDLSTELIK